VNTGIPTKRILIAHEETRPRGLLNAPERPEISREVKEVVWHVFQALVVTTILLGIAGMGAGIFSFLTVILSFALTILKGAAFLTIFALGALLFTVGPDPVVVAVIDDVDAEGNNVLSWVCLGMWYS
jgi:hypothetical protein